MKNVKRKSVGTHFSMCVQPAFIIGTNNEDGTHHAKDGKKDGILYNVCRGDVVDVPILDASRWVMNVKWFNQLKPESLLLFSAE